MAVEVIAIAKEQLTKQLPFVIYRKPNDSILKGIFQNEDSLHYAKDFTEEGFVLAPFDLNEPTILIKADVTRTCVINATENNTITKQKHVPEHFSEKEFHISLIHKGVEKIKSDTFKKVVLSRQIKTSCAVAPLNIYERLLASYSNAFCYIWYHPKIGLWLGATPETLIHFRANRITTNSLAGTQMYAGNANPNWGKKEQEEQQLVTDYILNAISNTATDITLSNVESIRAGNLLHLKTRISAKLENDKVEEIIRKLHPTPAVCGMPKEIAKKFILQNENYRRQFYTGFLGELNLKTELERTHRKRNIENKAYRSITKATELYVNLRCMQLKDDKALIYVGGGITKDSVPEKEWEETVNKSQTMLKVLYE